MPKVRHHVDQAQTQGHSKVSNTVYVVFPAGTKTDGEVIAPAEMTGAQSGNQLQVELEAAGISWRQWIHIDNVLLPEEVAEP